MIARCAPKLGWLLLAILLAGLGWMLIATCFMVYDDEGYVLISVRNFCDGRGLYTEVFSQYGPAFYLFYKLIHGVTGIVYDHEIGRLLTLGYWVASAMVVGLLTSRLTASRIAGWSAAMLGFVALAPNINEPFHPGSLLTLIGVLAAWAGAEGLLRGSRPMGLLVGALGTFALLIKINVGLFILAPWGAWWLLNLSPGTRIRRGVRWGMGMCVIAVPLVLMRKHLSEGWGLGFAWLFMAGALGFWLKLSRARSEDSPPTGWGWPAVIFSGVFLTVAGISILGTSPATLWHAAVIAPLSMPDTYAYAAGTTLWKSVLAWFSFALLIWIGRQPAGSWRTSVLVSIRAVGLTLYFWQVKTPVNEGSLVLYAFDWGPLLAGWMLTPLLPQHPRETLARQWLGWFFCWQILQAYPVAGSQVAWGSVLWTAIATIGCVDLWRYLAPRWRCSSVIGPAVLSGTALIAMGITLFCARAWWLDSLALGFPGASWVRPVPDISRSIQTLNTNIQRNAGLVFSLPGMFSFNLWSGHPSPTSANTTHWFSMLDARQQSDIIKALEADPDAVIIVQRDLLQLLLVRGYPPSGMLADYLRHSFVPTIRTGSYDLCVKRGRTIKAYDTFRIDGDHLVAWVTHPVTPCPLSLRDPGNPALPGILLPEARWTHENGDVWKIESVLPPSLRAGAGHYLSVSSLAGEIIFAENTLPVR